MAFALARCTDLTCSGTGDTLLFECFPDETARAAYYASVSTLAANASEVELGKVWAHQEWLAATCANSPNATAVGELIGTAFTARDMIQIVDALGEDGMLRFWGE